RRLVELGILLLALGTVMTATADNHHALNWRLTDQTGFAFAPVHAMLELEKTFLTVGINVIGDRRTSQSDRLFQDLLDRAVKSLEFRARNSRQPSFGTNASAKERLVSIDIANTAQQLLVEQCAFDRSLAAMKEREESVFFHLEGLDSARIEVS